jgi:glucokinase
VRKDSVIAVDIGGSSIKTAIVDKNNNVSHKNIQDTGIDPLATLKDLLENAFSETKCHISAIGIAAAGIIDRKTGKILKSPNLNSLTGVDLKNVVQQWHNLPVAIENDANAAAYGEKIAGAGADKNDFILLTLGTGIGCGIVAGGRLLGSAAEAGHMKVSSNGSQCSCGDTGCLEAYASGWAMVNSAIKSIEGGTESIMKQMHNGNFYKITPEGIYEAALEGDSLARGVLREAGRHLGIGIGSLINIFSPEAVILTGGLTGAWNIYVDVAIQEAGKRALRELFAENIIIPSALQGDAGIIGAACLAFDEIR